jgi:hypothetical protein
MHNCQAEATIPAYALSYAVLTILQLCAYSLSIPKPASGTTLHVQHRPFTRWQASPVMWLIV